MRSRPCATGVLTLVALLAAGPREAAATASTSERGAAASPSPALADAVAARAYLDTVRPDAQLQAFLDRAVSEIGREDPKLLASGARIAVIDLGASGGPRLAQVRGDDSVYPASVIKFIYLMAAYAWQEQGRLQIDAALDADLAAMVHHSSNAATQKVFRRLTGTEAGPELEATEYASFRTRRLAVRDWLRSLGIEDLHAVNPTYDGGGDLFGRDQQFLRDRAVPGGLPTGDGQYSNRNAMTASGTVRLLALLATDRALTSSDSEAVRRRMRRDVREQPYLAHRIAGGATRAGAEVYSKSGTWGPIFADAGIVRDAAGHQFALAVFTDASPPYRGDAIARLTHRLAMHLLAPGTAAPGTPGGSS